MPEYRNIPLNSDCYSEVAQPGERTLCVTIPEMVECGVSENTLKDGLRRYRQGLVCCWPHHKEGRTIYLHYEGLKPTYQKLIQSILMNGLSPDEWYNQKGRLNDLSKLFKPCLNITLADEKFLSDAKLPNGQSIPMDDMAKYREACMWLAFLTTCDKKVRIKQQGYTSSTKFWEDVCFCLDKQGVKLPGSYTKLREKIRIYKEQGVACVIDARTCTNNNAAKVYEEEQLGVLVTLIGNPKNLDCAQIARVYNEVATVKGWETITTTTVWNYKQKYDLETYAGRNGLQAFRNNVAMQVKRSGPQNPMSFWSLDGWDAELYYQMQTTDSKGHKVTTYHNRLTVVVVLDAYNKYPIGYAIGDRESANLIQLALKDAMDHTRGLLGAYYKPLQTQSDHYAMKQMTPYYEALSKHFTPARVKNAKAKPIERYFHYLNKTYFQLLFGNWSGQGVKCKGQPNIDYLDANKKKFPDRTGCMQQIISVLEKEREVKRAEFTERWIQVSEENRLPLTRENYLYLFGTRHTETNRLQGDGLTPTLLGIERSYDCFDIRFRKQRLTSWQVIYDKDDLSTVLVTDKTEKERFLLQDKFVQPIALADRKEGDYTELKVVDSYNKAVLEPYVTEKISGANELAYSVWENTPALRGKLSGLLLSDSRGQHKDYLKPAALMKSEEDLAAEMEEKEKKAIVQVQERRVRKEKRQAAKEHEAIYDAYLEETVDYSKYK